jgi:DNA-binding NtrC family response regulator/PAS domain-containing protein
MSRVTPSSRTIRWPHRGVAAGLLASIVVSVIVIVPAAVRVHAGPALPLATYAHRAWTTSQLEGYDTTWVDAGTRRVAHYANLAAGNYRFHVLARGSDGRWSEQGATLALALAPRVHQRRIVQLAALIGAIAAAFAVFRLVAARSRQRARRLETLVAERTVELQRERDALAGANQELVRTNEQLNAARLIAEASHIHLLAMLDQLGIGVIVVDLQEQVRFASQVTRRLIAAPEGDAVVGRRLHEVLPIPPATLAELRTALLTPRPGARITAKLQPSAGQRYWTEIEARVDPRDKGHRVLYLYDVTEAYDVEPLPPVDRRGAGAALVGASPAMRIVRAQIATAAGVDATVLIEGQTGTGKELVARAIHEASRRRARPFVAINCAGLTESLLASQLFGHTRGAFTGAIADQIGLFQAAQGGTLLLDEIGDMPMSMQAHLLRVLQEREIVRVGESRARPIDVRVLAATHRSLDEEVIAGRFREDLLYRIRVVRIELPALRQRTEDIPQLAYAFLAQFAASHGRQLDSIAREAMERLIGLRWQGNVRELRSVIEWAVIHARGPVIKLSDLPREVATDGAPPPRPRPTVPDAERRLLIETLKRTQGNRSMAARLLGVSRATLYRRLAEMDAGDAAGADAPVCATAGALGDATGARQQPPIAGDPS